MKPRTSPTYSFFGFSAPRWLGGVAAMVAGAMAFSPAPLSAQNTNAKVGVVLKGTSNFWNAVADGARAAGAAHAVEIDVRMPETESQIEVQIQMVADLVDAGVDALVIAPGSSVRLSEPVSAAAAEGVTVVVIDTAIGGEMPAYIATNHTTAGEAAGRLLASLVEADEAVAILKHSRTSGATTLREVSAFAELNRAHPGIVVYRDVYAGNDPAQQVPNALSLLERHPDSAGILASGTPGSMAMLRALQESGRAGSIKFVGFGFNLNPTVAAAIEAGEMHGWIAQLPADIGTRGVNAAVALLEGRPVDEISFCDFLVITRDNLHDPEVQALLPAE